MARSISMRAVRVIADIVFDGAIPSGDRVAAAPVAQRAALIGAVRERGIAAQRRDRGHQLECRARRILPVARAIQQFVRRGRRGTHRGRIRDRRADHGEHVARARLHHHQRSVGDSRLPQVPFQNLLGTHLQADVHRHAQGAVARQNARDAGVARVMPVADERRQFGVLVALQPAIGVVLHQRCVAGVKILAGAQVARQVRGGGAERVVAAVEAAGGRLERDAERGVGIAMALQFLPVAGGERNAVAVVDGAARNLARQRVDARIVLRALDAVLFEGVRIARQVVAIVQHLVAQRRTPAGSRRPRPAPTSSGRPARAAPSGCVASSALLMLGQQREDQEIRHHRGISRTQKRRDHARKRQRAEHAGRDQQHLAGDEGGEAGGQKKSVGGVGALGGANAAPDQKRRTAAKTAATPAKPHSSPIAGSTRSVLPAGITPGSPHPGPLPVGPPVAKAQSACASWSPPWTSLSQGESHMSMRCTTVCGVPARYPTATAATIRTTAATASDGRPRATVNIARNTKSVTSAGPKVLQHEKEHQRDAGGHQHRKHVLRARHASARDARLRADRAGAPSCA